MHKLSDIRIKELISRAKVIKQNGETLVDLFEAFAKENGLSKGSVRNIYYKALKGGNGGGLKAKIVKPFSENEEKEMIRKVLFARKNTKTMKEAFLLVAKGDEKLAMRYQDKYGNLVKKRRADIMREIINQKRVTGSCFNPYLAKSQKEERVKLKKEIDELVKIISEKCVKENQLLKQKLSAYQKLCDNCYEYSGLGVERDRRQNFFVMKIKGKTPQKAT